MQRGQIIKEIKIPKSEYIALEVKKGQVLRITEIEGPQVADVNAYNLHNPKEKLQSALSAQLNKSYETFTILYTNALEMNPILTVVDDPVGAHFLSGSLGCTRKHYEMRGYGKNHPNCFDNLAAAVKPWGLGHYDVHGPFCAFMRVEYGERGDMRILPPKAKKGDYVDVRTEMDTLIAISACPEDSTPCNGEDWTPKPLKISLFDM